MLDYQEQDQDDRNQERVARKTVLGRTLLTFFVLTEPASSMAKPDWRGEVTNIQGTDVFLFFFLFFFLLVFFIFFFRGQTSEKSA